MTIGAWLIAMVANVVALALNIDGASKGMRSCVARGIGHALLLIALMLFAPIGY